MFNFTRRDGTSQIEMDDGLGETLERAVRGAAVTREVAVQRAAASRLPAVAARHMRGRQLVVVADATTWQVAGHAVQAQLHAHAAAAGEPIVLQAQPRLKPRVEIAQALAAQLRATHSVPVAVGSGVLSDLVKYAAALAQQPYLCFATAASMDGYAASGAALLDGAFKRTLPCAPPLAVVADIDVLAQAPARMAGWGFGDLAGKVVAGADWLLADALGVDRLNPEPFALVQEPLARWLGSPRQLAAREPAALANLLGGLLVSGFAMQAHGNSRPASGSDHQFSHLWEMEGLLVDGEPAAHGACVGIGCVAMLALYDWLLAQPEAQLHARLAQAAADPATANEAALDAEINQALGEGEVAAAAAQEMQAKRALGPRAERVALFGAIWPDLREVLQARHVSACVMQQSLRAAGVASHPHALGIGLAQLARDYRRARLIRRRYTLLDLLEDTGLLQPAVADLFAPGGFWGRQSAYPLASNPTSPQGDKR